jgi:antitoxin HicB
MATLMLEGAADRRFIQRMLGYADLKSTRIYASGGAPASGHSQDQSSGRETGDGGKEGRMIEVAAMTEYSFTVLFEPAEEGGFVVTCPALPGLVTEGDTLEQARAMAQDAIRGYIESLRKDHLPIPSDKTVKEEIRVLVPEPA